MTRITGTLHEDQYTFIVISSRNILRKRNVSDKFVTKIKTHFKFNNVFFFENLAFYEIMWKNIVKPDGSNMKI